MTQISPECEENAIGMLRSKPEYFIGWVGDIRYYIVDGKFWSHSLGGRVSRCDSNEECADLARAVRVLNKNDGEGQMLRGRLALAVKALAVWIGVAALAGDGVPNDIVDWAQDTMDASSNLTGIDLARLVMAEGGRL